MKVIIKNLKHYKKIVALIVVLLIVQAVCDLSLPSYTSGLIDVGIMNKGIEYALPQKISKDAHKAASFLMTEDEADLWQKSYEEKEPGSLQLKPGVNEKELDAVFAQPLAVYQMIASADGGGFGENGSQGGGLDFEALDLTALIGELELSPHEYGQLIKALKPALDGPKLFEEYSLEKEALFKLLLQINPSKVKDFNFQTLFDSSKLDRALLLKSLGLGKPEQISQALQALSDEDLQTAVGLIRPALKQEEIEKNLGLDTEFTDLLLSSLKADTVKKLIVSAGGEGFEIQDYLGLGGQGMGFDSLSKMNPAQAEAFLAAFLPAIDRAGLAKALGLPQRLVERALNEIPVKVLAGLLTDPPSADVFEKALDKNKIDYAALMPLLASKGDAVDMGALFAADDLSAQEKRQLAQALEPAIKWEELAKKTGMTTGALKLAYRLNGLGGLATAPGAATGEDFSQYIDFEKVDYEALLPLMKNSPSDFDALALAQGDDWTEEEKAILIKAIIPAVDSRVLAAETGISKDLTEAFLKQTPPESLAALMTGQAPAFELENIIDTSKINYEKLKTALGAGMNWQAISKQIGLEEDVLKELFRALPPAALGKFLNPSAPSADLNDLLDFSKVDMKALFKIPSLSPGKLLRLDSTNDAHLRAAFMNLIVAMDEKALAANLGVRKEELAVLTSKMTAAGTQNLIDDLMTNELSSKLREIIDFDKADKDALMAGLGLDFSSFESLLSKLPPSLEKSIGTVFAGLRSEMDEKTKDLGSSVLRSFAIAFVSAEYEKLGLDIGAVQTAYLWKTGLKMLGITLIAALSAVIVSFFASRTGAAVGRDLREKVFGRVISFSSSDIEKFSTASLITRSTNDIQQIQGVTTMLLRMMLSAPILAVGGTIMVARTGADMWWIIAGALVVLLLIAGGLMAMTMPKFKKMQTLIDKLNLVSREMLTGLSVIRAFGREKEEEERFEDANRALTKTMTFTNRVMSTSFPMLMLGMNLLAIVIVWVSSKRIDAGSLQVGAMTAFITYAIIIIMGFLMLTFMSVMLPRAAVAARRIDEVIQTPPSVRDPEKPMLIKTKSGLVEFDNVSFAYPGAKEEVLKNISFKAVPGQTTAIVGSTGSGKSTMVDLLARFYDVSSGSIKIDGIDIRDLEQKEVRGMMGYVPQKSILFSGSVSSNLRFGREEANLGELEEATDIAQASGFIKETKGGYEHEIAQGGSNVSGGQKQRLSIARAVVKSPLIYIFDDSFSALDFKTDLALRKALAPKTKKSTVLIVAQRISTVLHADNILVLDQGHLVGQGKHSQLMAECEVYRQIAKSQLSQEELELEEGEEE